MPQNAEGGVTAPGEGENTARGGAVARRTGLCAPPPSRSVCCVQLCLRSARQFVEDEVSATEATVRPLLLLVGGEGSSGTGGSGERDIRLGNEQRLPDIFYLLMDWVII
jgi:hypothetical protein